jgi:hypothetical protein
MAKERGGGEPFDEQGKLREAKQPSALKRNRAPASEGKRGVRFDSEVDSGPEVQAEVDHGKLLGNLRVMEKLILGGKEGLLDGYFSLLERAREAGIKYNPQWVDNELADKSLFLEGDSFDSKLESAKQVGATPKIKAGLAAMEKRYKKLVKNDQVIREGNLEMVQARLARIQDIQAELFPKAENKGVLSRIFGRFAKSEKQAGTSAAPRDQSQVGVSNFSSLTERQLGEALLERDKAAETIEDRARFEGLDDEVERRELDPFDLMDLAQSPEDEAGASAAPREQSAAWQDTRPQTDRNSSMGGMLGTMRDNGVAVQAAGGDLDLGDGPDATADAGADKSDYGSVAEVQEAVKAAEADTIDATWGEYVEANPTENTDAGWENYLENASDEGLRGTHMDFQQGFQKARAAGGTEMADRYIASMAAVNQAIQARVDVVMSASPTNQVTGSYSADAGADTIDATWGEYVQANPTENTGKGWENYLENASDEGLQRTLSDCEGEYLSAALLDDDPTAQAWKNARMDVEATLEARAEVAQAPSSIPSSGQR